MGGRPIPPSPLWGGGTALRSRAKACYSDQTNPKGIIFRSLIEKERGGSYRPKSIIYKGETSAFHGVNASPLEMSPLGSSSEGNGSSAQSGRRPFQRELPREVQGQVRTRLAGRTQAARAALMRLLQSDFLRPLPLLGPRVLISPPVLAMFSSLYRFPPKSSLFGTLPRLGEPAWQRPQGERWTGSCEAWWGEGEEGGGGAGVRGAACIRGGITPHSGRAPVHPQIPGRVNALRGTSLPASTWAWASV